MHGKHETTYFLMYKIYLDMHAYNYIFISWRMRFRYVYIKPGYHIDTEVKESWRKIAFFWLAMVLLEYQQNEEIRKKTSAFEKNIDANRQMHVALPSTLRYTDHPEIFWKIEVFHFWRKIRDFTFFIY